MTKLQIRALFKYMSESDRLVKEDLNGFRLIVQGCNTVGKLQLARKELEGDVSTFGVPALAAKGCDQGCGYGLMGFVSDEAFLLFTGADSEEELDAFLPTFEQMVASIAPEN